MNRGVRAVRLLPILLLSLLVATLPAPSAPELRADDAVAGPVSVAVDRALDPRVEASVGVWDPETGERLYGYRSDEPRRTASVMKLATSLAALTALGPDYRLSTEFRSSAAPQDGVLEGDLVVVGGGDPGFSARFAGTSAAAFDAVAEALLGAGVQDVRGDVVLDLTRFPGPDRHPDWGHRPGLLQWWRAPVAALTVNDSCLDVRAEPGESVGAAARLRLDPRSSLVPVENDIRTVARKADHKLVYGPRGADPGLRGKGGIWVRSGGVESSLACFDPPAVFGEQLVAALERAGIAVGGEVRLVRASVEAWREGAVDVPDAPVLLHRRGTPLLDVVRVCNQRSQNLYAELLLRCLGWELLGEGSFETGARATRRALAVPDDDDSFHQSDGSGLSRANVATVDAIGRLLVRAWHSDVRGDFLDSLARGGDPDGTLRRRFRGDEYEGRVLGKTGTLRDTSALAGFVRVGEGRVLAYAVLTEGVVAHGRAVQDAVVRALVRSGR